MIVFAILPVISFFLLWIFFLAQESAKDEYGIDWQESLIKSGLSWSVVLVLGTELLSFGKGLTIVGVSLFWGLTGLILGIIHWQRHTFSSGWERFKGLLANIKLMWFETIAFALIFIILGILLVTGLMSPPNIHDVLTYHMSRVMHWVQNRSVAFYPTSITWQLWMPPFSEFSQLHWLLFAGGDLFSSLHQWYSLILSMVTVAAIAKDLGANRRGQLLSALFVLTIPVVVLQASGAKNDVVLAFIFASLTYFVLKLVNHPNDLMNWTFIGIAVGLGLLTKGNFPFFALPLLLWLLISVLRKTGMKKTLAFGGTGVLMVFILNSGQWIRNTFTFGGPFNTGDASFTLNARFGVDVVISNLLRNIAVQLNRVGFVTNFNLDVLARIHGWMGIPLYDPSITHGPREFFINPIREEVAGNPFHFVVTGLVFIALLVILLRENDRTELWKPFILSLSAITGMVIFSGVFRWQVWGSRYFIPYYILFAPVVGTVVGTRFQKGFTWVLGLFLVIIILNPLLNNYPRAFSWSEANRNSIWGRSRKGLRFASHETYEGAVLELTHLMDVSGCREYGMSIGLNSPEYLIWGTLTPDPADYRLEHIAVENPSAIYTDEEFTPCGILVFESVHPDIIVTGEYELIDRWKLLPDDLMYSLALYLQPDFIPAVVE